MRAAIDELQWHEYASRTGTRLMRPVHRRHRGAHASGAGAAPMPGRRRQRCVPLARILLVSAGQTLSEHALYPGRLIIGRTAANDLQIDSRFVSRHHCQIVTTAQSCVIEDLNSTNGIFMHG